MSEGFLVQLFVIVFGCMSIGYMWLRVPGALLGLIIGVYLLYKLRKRTQIDYGRIEKMFQKYQK